MFYFEFKNIFFRDDLVLKLDIHARIVDIPDFIRVEVGLIVFFDFIFDNGGERLFNDHKKEFFLFDLERAFFRME